MVNSLVRTERNKERNDGSDINSAVDVKLLSEPNNSEMGLTTPDKEKNL